MCSARIVPSSGIVTCLDFGCAAPVVLGKPGAQHLARVIPFVERRVDVEPFVALQANELGAGKLRHHFCELGFPAPGLALDQQRLSHFTRQVRCRRMRNGVVTVQEVQTLELGDLIRSCHRH